MLSTPTFIFALGAFLSLPSAILGGLVQKQGLTVPSAYDTQQGDVKQIFLDSYSAYQQFAFGHDEVFPMNKSFNDPLNGWGATIVDAMTTMKIMDLNDLFADAVKFASDIDFSKSQTSSTVSVFETTIRYLGGLLSAYELSGMQYPQLLDKAKEVADKMLYAWDGNNAIPYSQIDLSTNTFKEVGSSNIAEAGSLTLEWATLSKYTKDTKYKTLAEKAALHITNLSCQFPGLPAQLIDPSTGLSVGNKISWGANSDSYFEYLIKYARMNSSVDPKFADTWRTAVGSSINLLLKTSTVGNHVYLADYEGSKILHVGSHLACFYGGNWLLGGQLMDNSTIVNIGLELTDSCWNTYASTVTQIGPDSFAFSSEDGNYTGSFSPPTPEETAFYELNGFYITDPSYFLRPEVLESNFYAWRVTGDTKYLDRASSAITAFQKYSSVWNGTHINGYVGINDVNNVNSTKINETQSFWFAEVLKYLYLTFDDPSRFSLDEYVFNTEAHPFKVPSGCANDTYGTGKKRTSTAPVEAVSGTPAVSPIPKYLRAIACFVVFVIWL